jgi:hypothetical protein
MKLSASSPLSPSRAPGLDLGRQRIGLGDVVSMPPVRLSTSGLPRASTITWIFVVSPPRKQAVAQFACCGMRKLLTLQDPAIQSKQPICQRRNLIYLNARPRSRRMLVADRGGPTMFARISMMRALNRHVEQWLI